MDPFSLAYLRRYYCSATFILIMLLTMLKGYAYTCDPTEPPDIDSAIYKHLLSVGYQDHDLIHRLPTPPSFELACWLLGVLLCVIIIIAFYIEFACFLAYLIGPIPDMYMLTWLWDFMDYIFYLIARTHLFYYDSRSTTFTTDKVLRNGNTIHQNWCHSCRVYGHDCNTRTYGMETIINLSAEHKVINFLTSTKIANAPLKSNAYSVKTYNSKDANSQRSTISYSKPTLVAIMPDDYDMTPFTPVTLRNNELTIWINVYQELPHVVLVKIKSLVDWNAFVSHHLSTPFYDVTTYTKFIPQDVRIIDTVILNSVPIHDKTVDKAIFRLFDNIRTKQGIITIGSGSGTGHGLLKSPVPPIVSPVVAASAPASIPVVPAPTEPINENASSSYVDSEVKGDDAVPISTQDSSKPLNRVTIISYVIMVFQSIFKRSSPIKQLPLSTYTRLQWLKKKNVAPIEKPGDVNINHSSAQALFAEMGIEERYHTDLIDILKFYRTKPDLSQYSLKAYLDKYSSGKDVETINSSTLDDVVVGDLISLSDLDGVPVSPSTDVTANLDKDCIALGVSVSGEPNSPSMGATIEDNTAVTTIETEVATSSGTVVSVNPDGSLPLSSQVIDTVVETPHRAEWLAPRRTVGAAADTGSVVGSGSSPGATLRVKLRPERHLRVPNFKNYPCHICGRQFKSLRACEEHSGQAHIVKGDAVTNTSISKTIILLLLISTVTCTTIYLIDPLSELTCPDNAITFEDTKLDDDLSILTIAQYYQLNDGKGYYISKDYQPKPNCKSLDYIYNNFNGNLNLIYFLNFDFLLPELIDNQLTVHPSEHPEVNTLLNTYTIADLNSSIERLDLPIINVVDNAPLILTKYEQIKDIEVKIGKSIKKRILKGKFGNENVLRICDSFIKYETCSHSEEKPEFPVEHLTNTALVTYRNTFVDLEPDQFSAGSTQYTLPIFLYTHDTCKEKAGNMCKFRKEDFAYLSCENPYGLVFECIVGDEICADYQTEYCNAQNYVPDSIKSAEAVIDNVVDVISNATKTVINETITKPLEKLNYIKRTVIKNSPPKFQRKLFNTGFIDFDCNLLNHPDVEVLHEHCIARHDINITLYHVDFIETAYVVKPIHTNFNDTDFISKLEHSIGFDTSDGDKRLLFRFMYYTPGEWTYYYKLTGETLEKSGYGRRGDFLTFNDPSTELLSPYIGILWIDQFFALFEVGKFIIYCFLVILAFYTTSSNLSQGIVVLRTIILVAFMTFFTHASTYNASFIFTYAFGLPTNYIIFTYFAVFFGALLNLTHNLRSYKLSWFDLSMDIFNLTITFIICITAYPGFVAWGIICLATCIYYTYGIRTSDLYSKFVHHNEAIDYVNHYIRSNNFDNKQSCKAHLINRLHSAKGEQADEYHFILQCLTYTERPEFGGFWPKRRLSGINESITECFTNNNNYSKVKSIANIDPLRNVYCTYANCSLWGFCDTVDGVPFLYVERHIFHERGFINPGYEGKIKWDSFTTKSEMELDFDNVVFNQGFAMIPYKGYHTFSSIKRNTSPLNYNGSGVFALNGGFVAGYVDHGRHNFSTNKGDCGAQVFDSNGALLGLHCAGANAGFVECSPWRKLIGTTNVNYFTTLEGDVCHEINGFDQHTINVQTTKPVLDPTKVMSAFKVVVPKSVSANYSNLLRDYFNISKNDFNSHPFDYDDFMKNLSTYNATNYAGMSLGCAFLYGLDSKKKVNRTHVEASVAHISSGYLDLVLHLYFLIFCVFYKTLNYLRSVISMHQYIRPSFHYWYFEELSCVSQLIHILHGFMHVRPTTRFKSFLIWTYTIFAIISLFILHIPSCSPPEDSLNLATFLNSTTHECYDLAGNYYNQTISNTDVYSSKFGYAIRHSSTITFGAVKIFGWTVFYPSVASVINYVRYMALFQQTHDRICYVPDNHCSSYFWSRVHGATAASALFGFLSCCIICVDIFTTFIRIINVYHFFRLFYHSRINYKALSRMYFRGHAVIEDPSNILEAEKSSKLFKNEVDSINQQLVILSTLPQFEDAKPHVQFLQGFVDRLLDSDEVSDADARGYAQVRYYIAQKFGPIWEIVKPFENQKSLLRTIFVNAFHKDSISTDDIDKICKLLHNTLKEKVEVPSRHTITEPFLLEAEALFNMVVFDDYINSNNTDFMTYFNQYRDDQEFMDSFYSARDEINMMLDDKRSGLEIQRDNADNKLQKRDVNLAITSFQKLMSEIKKEFNKLDTIEKQKSAVIAKEQRKMDNIDKVNQQKALKDIKKRESAAAALAGIIKYVKRKQVHLGNKLENDLLREATKNDFDLEPNYYANFYAPCGLTVLSCKQSHQHSFNNCFSNLRSAYNDHVNDCTKCVKRLLDTRHPVCGVKAKYEPIFRSYYREIIHCAKCMVCPTCVNTGTRSPLCRDFYHGLAEMYIINPIIRSTLKVYKYMGGRAIRDADTILAYLVPSSVSIKDYRHVQRASVKQGMSLYVHFNISRNDDINTCLLLLNDENVQIHGDLTPTSKTECNDEQPTDEIIDAFDACISTLPVPLMPQSSYNPAPVTDIKSLETQLADLSKQIEYYRANMPTNSADPKN
ncbi:hypothetical protein QKS33_gp1 [Insect mesonivirus 1]|uniref:C2H2-type domain-containing protein n=1 Tax=Insect mesonivirus 1 TaxID=2819081 RepID=A0AAE7M8W8_9NIDO|nr:hypothetical protein QKS33_gp1 [Insect mesonivirus 1]QNM37790.1 hypothetical protein [Insect mesonivirus 1]